MSVGVLFLFAVMLFVVLKFNNKVSTGVMKLLISFAQIMAAVSAFEAPWPGAFTYVISWFSFLNLNVLDLSSPACMGLHVTFYHKWIAVMTAPWLVAGCVWLPVGLLKCCRRGDGPTRDVDDTTSTPTERAMSRMVVLCLLAHPGVSGVMLVSA